MVDIWDVIVVGSGNAGLCAALAAQEAFERILVIEKAKPELKGGNTAFSGGAMRFTYDGFSDIRSLLQDVDDPRLARADFGSYSKKAFAADLSSFNNGRPLSIEQNVLIEESLPTMRWLASKGVEFEPIFSRQSFEKNGRLAFWGGLTLAAKGEGSGLAASERAEFERHGGTVIYDCAATELVMSDGRVVGVETSDAAGHRKTLRANAVVLAAGGFGSNQALLRQYLGRGMDRAVFRGTPHNTGDGLKMAFRVGARPHGVFEGCHAVPMGIRMYSHDKALPAGFESTRLRKLCYFLGVMLNSQGRRFVDEGADFRNYTYAQYGQAILEQPGSIAYQIFDAKVDHLLYEEYGAPSANFVEADTIDDLLVRLEGIDSETARNTITMFNAAVDDQVEFDPAVKDGKSAVGLVPPRLNWAQKLDRAPFRAYPVTGGITFTYGGVQVDASGAVMGKNDLPIQGLFACGEMVGGVFFNGYPGGSGLTSGAVFGRRAGIGAAAFSRACQSATKLEYRGML
ncbi:FAD-dependent tricarballylate dehydrogenase TcuA [Agrobacterium rosae]|uniref:Fumarate reductase flavoprotein subunit n=1 Tax=Agrobacterium rosae TaxID=1972867 RepID=A0A1R3U1M4_9HYPH|nr:FAD-dependent tricarballylate dehydrogenase TcuA [Agrobacterium rosae]SCX35128.1 Fumarate reductase flavoprotein subunit precursor [Agrobacterium rosae]